MTEWNIWMSGYQATCEHETAQFVGVFKAETFAEACAAAAVEKGWKNFDPVRLTEWGCGLYDNEADARRAFG